MILPRFQRPFSFNSKNPQSYLRPQTAIRGHEQPRSDNSDIRARMALQNVLNDDSGIQGSKKSFSCDQKIKNLDITLTWSVESHATELQPTTDGWGVCMAAPGPSEQTCQRPNSRASPAASLTPSLTASPTPSPSPVPHIQKATVSSRRTPKPRNRRRSKQSSPPKPVYRRKRFFQEHQIKWIRDRLWGPHPETNVKQVRLDFIKKFATPGDVIWKNFVDEKGIFRPTEETGSDSAKKREPKNNVPYSDLELMFIQYHRHDLSLDWDSVLFAYIAWFNTARQTTGGVQSVYYRNHWIPLFDREGEIIRDPGGNIFYQRITERQRKEHPKGPKLDGNGQPIAKRKHIGTDDRHRIWEMETIQEEEAAKIFDAMNQYFWLCKSNPEHAQILPFIRKKDQEASIQLLRERGGELLAGAERTLQGPVQDQYEDNSDRDSMDCT